MAPASSQGAFTCPLARSPACLDYSDIVCDGARAKCVSRTASCYENLYCDYNGVICASEYERAIDKHNELVDDYNSLNSKYKTCISDIFSYQSKLDRIKSCIIRAESLEEAKSCYE